VKGYGPTPCFEREILRTTVLTVNAERTHDDPESQLIEKPQQASHFPTNSAFSGGNVPGLTWTFTRTFTWSGLNLTVSRGGVAFSPIEAKRLADEIFQGVCLTYTGTFPTGNLFDLCGKSGMGIPLLLETHLDVCGTSGIGIHTEEDLRET